MFHRFSTRWVIVVLTAAGLTLSGWFAVRAADPKQIDAKKPDAARTDKDPGTKAEKAASVNQVQFTVPDGKPDELVKFIEKIQKARSKSKVRADLIEFYTKSRRAIVEAADKILAADADGKTRAKAAEAKFDGLSLLQQLQDPDAGKQAQEMLQTIKQDKQPEMKRLATFIEFRNQMGEAMQDPDAADKLFDDLKAELKSNPSKNLAMLAVALASRQEHESPAAAVKSLRELADIAAKSKDPEVAELAQKFKGTVRRLNLMGQPIEIKGRLLDGTPFDQSTLKGKVVLVDFWATWCGPCVAELPNVKVNYEKYHDKGFEVVGISLDDDLDALKEFIAKEKLPWPILFSNEEKDQSWENPMAVYYGVNSIPCVVLANQKGEVVSLDARGPELGKKLEELLGKVEEKETNAEVQKANETKKQN